MSATLTLTAKNETGQAFREIRTDAAAAATGVDKLDKELKASADSARKLADSGKRASISLGDILGVGRDVTVIMHGLKEAVKLTGEAISFMAERGSPAFIELRDSISEAQTSLVKLADDPAWDGLITGTAGGIRDTLIPAIDSIPNRLIRAGVEGNKAWISLKETLGILSKDQADSVRSFLDSSEQVANSARESAKEERNRISIENEILAVSEKLAAQNEAAALARIDDEQTIKTLIEEQRDALRSLDVESSDYTKKKTDGLAKLELLEKSLQNAEQKRFDLEIKAAEQSSKERAEAEKEYQRVLEETKKAAAETRQAKLDSEKAEAQKIIADLQAAIAEAKGAAGGSSLDQLRGQISGKDLRSDIVRNRQEAARQQVLDARRAQGMVDQNGKAVGETDEDRRLNQRRLDADLAQASRQATIIATRQINRGGIGADEIRAAQDARLQSAANRAFGNDSKEAQAFRAQMEAERAAFMKQQQAGAFQQKVAALNVSGGQQAIGQLPGATGNLAGATGQLADVAGQGVSQALSTATAAETKAQAAIDMILQANNASKQSAARQKAQRGGYGS